jgi:mannose-1-phosphate guanylyltransferase / mannose-6-phosphate isomerase
MTNQTITPIILCGGSDTRLWPLSRKSFLKQVVPLIDHKSLLQLTLERMAQGNGDGVLSEVICAAAENHRFLVRDPVQEAKIKSRIILERAKWAELLPSRCNQPK